MKKIFKLIPAMFMMCLLVTVNIMAEESESTEKAENTEEQIKPERKISTLFGDINNDGLFISGYLAATPSYTRIKGKDSMLMGGRGGLIINNFVIGGGGYGLVYPREAKDYGIDITDSDKEYVNFGYGGGMLEYYLFPTKLVHVSLGTLVGGGGFNYSSKKDDDDDDDYEGDAFFVVEPEANIFINVTRFCRLGVGASYRYVNGIDDENFKDKDFSGASAKVIVAFGWF
ncbi:MAG: hypothetical protein JW864_00355 [Spirochaetes bacterium]|nr:hypothetical protein [Spirochaetota bacterium]